MARTFTADLYAGNFRIREAQFPTVTAARRWAEEYGTTADLCLIRSPTRGAPDRIVATHKRDGNGDGLRWYRTTA